MARIVVDLPDAANDALSQLAEAQNLSVGQLLQQAVALYNFAIKKSEGGNVLSLTSPTGELVATIDLGKAGAGKS